MKHYRVRVSDGRIGGGWSAEVPRFEGIAPGGTQATLPQPIPMSSGPSWPCPAPAPTGLVDWLDRLAACGLNANRHSSPDLTGQFHQLLKRPVDTVLCTLLDESVQLPLNGALAHHYPAELLAGIWLMSELTGAANRWIVVDGGIPNRWLAGIKEGAAQLRLRRISVRNDYPQSDPTILLHTLLNRRLRPGRLPTERGVLLFDAAAAVDIGRFVLTGEPATWVPMAFGDHSAATSRLVLVKAGMKLQEAMSAAGIRIEGKVLRAGDILRDVQISPDEVVGRSELVIHASLQEPACSPDSCIRCGWCVEGCPTRIQPAGLLEASQRRDLNLADHYGLEACIECGICTYVCPSHLPLLDSIRQLQRQYERMMNRSAAGETESGG